MVAALLASADPAEQAWGAHLAANYQQTKFVPDLRRFLTASHPDVRLQALDALIRLKADVPAGELMPLWPTHRTPVLILLAADAKKNEDNLHSLTREDLDSKEWVAVHNLLVLTRAPGIVAELLSALQVHVMVWVQDSGRFGPGYGGGIGGGSSMCGGAGMRPGFPPLFYYALVDVPSPGDVMLAPGRHPIFYRRSQNPSNSAVTIDRNVYRFEYLADLAGVAVKDLPLQPTVSLTVTWKGADAYLAELRVARQQVLANFATLSRMLEEPDAGLPQIEFTVMDIRVNQQSPLPETPQ